MKFNVYAVKSPESGEKRCIMPLVVNGIQDPIKDCLLDDEQVFATFTMDTSKTDLNDNVLKNMLELESAMCRAHDTSIQYISVLIALTAETILAI